MGSSRGDMEASLQAAQGGSEQKCGNDKCIMCTTLDRFGGLSVCFGKDDDFEKKIENHLFPRQEADEERAAGVERGGRRRGGDFFLVCPLKTGVSILILFHVHFQEFGRSRSRERLCSPEKEGGGAAQEVSSSPKPPPLPRKTVPPYQEYRCNRHLLCRLLSKNFYVCFKKQSGLVLRRANLCWRKPEGRKDGRSKRWEFLFILRFFSISIIIL